VTIEAMKLAFADTYAHVADPRAMRVTPEQMLDDEYLASRAALIDMARAQPLPPAACLRAARSTCRRRMPAA